MLGTVPLLRPPAPFVCWPFASLRGSSAPSPGSWFLAQGGSGSSAGLLSTGAECHLCWGRWRQHGAGGDWVSASVQGLCPSVMSSSSPGSMGMLWQRWDLGGSVVFLSLPTPWGPHSVPIPPWAPCSAPSHPTRGTTFGRTAWGPGDQRVVAVASRTHPLQLSPVTPGCVSISKCPAAQTVGQPWSAGRSQRWVPEPLSWPLLGPSVLHGLGRTGSPWHHSPGLSVKAGHNHPSCC